MNFRGDFSEMYRETLIKEVGDYRGRGECYVKEEERRCVFIKGP
jgi:hypothetical protein